MAISSADIADLIFMRSVKKEVGEFSLNPQMLNVLMELDGEAPLAMIARRVGLNMATMQEVINRLLQLQLIEKTNKHPPPLDPDFIEYLIARFSLAVGPIAVVLIEDEVRQFGYDMSQFPSHRISELVERLAAGIRREDKRSDFVSNIGKKIVEKGYLV